jgi:hypothetical protein
MNKSPKPADVISGAIFSLTEGEPLPAMNSKKFAALMAAVTALNDLPPERARTVFTQVGTQVMNILTRRIQASLKAEKILALLHDSRPLH